ncbi:MAG: phosphoribosylformylglycinamidine synthase subunit PurQ [Odoribacter sp.]
MTGFQSGFINVTIEPNHSVMLKSLAGSRLGICIAHAEGKFSLPYADSENIPVKYSYDVYPANPNGSPFAIGQRSVVRMAGIWQLCLIWNVPFIRRIGLIMPSYRENDEVSPWIEAFVNARKWIRKNKDKKVL